MNKLSTILEELPKTESALKWYVELCSKEIKTCLTKIKELELAQGECQKILRTINDQRSEDEKAADS